jgi:hypothetical protein
VRAAFDGGAETAEYIRRPGDVSSFYAISKTAADWESMLLMKCLHIRPDI